MYKRELIVLLSDIARDYGYKILECHPEKHTIDLFCDSYPKSNAKNEIVCIRTIINIGRNSLEIEQYCDTCFDDIIRPKKYKIDMSDIDMIHKLKDIMYNWNIEER